MGINIQDMRYRLITPRRGSTNRGRCFDDVMVEARANAIAEQGPLMGHIGQDAGFGMVIARDGFPRRAKRVKGGFAAMMQADKLKANALAMEQARNQGAIGA